MRTLGWTQLFVICLLCSPAGVGIASSLPAGETGQPLDSHHSSVARSGSIAVQPVNNSTDQHKNPATAGESGDLGSVQSHLARKLSSRLAGSTIQLTQGQYQQANETIGSQYDSLLGKYVDVAGETGRNTEAGETFTEAQQVQQEFGKDLREYRQTREAYEQAVANGNKSRARALARELQQQAENVTASGQTVADLLQQTQNQTSASSPAITEAVQAVNQTLGNVSATTESVVSTEFIETRLVITEQQDATASVTNPLVVEGRLLTENDTAITNRTIQLTIAGQQRTVTTDAAGRFTIIYKPTTAPIGEQPLRFRYQPQADSVYLGTTTNISVTIAQSTGDLTVNTEKTAAFGEQLFIRGTLTVNDTAISNYPLVLFVGDTRVGTVRTNASGGFVFSTVLPAEVENGTQSVTVRPAVSERAVTAPPAQTELTVQQTVTELSITANATGEGTIRLFGLLQTTDGTPIPSQSVAVTIGGTTVTTVQTGSGRFATTIDVPAAVTPGESVTVTVTFSGRETSLTRSLAQERVAIPSVSGGSESGDGVLGLSGSESGILLALLLAVILGTGGGLWYLSRSAVGDASGETHSVGSTTEEESSGPTHPILATASETVDENVTIAVALAVDALKRQTGIAPSATYAELHDAVTDNVKEPVEQVVKTYERTAFREEQISQDAAEEAIAAAREALSGEQE